MKVTSLYRAQLRAMNWLSENIWAGILANIAVLAFAIYAKYFLN